MTSITDQALDLAFSPLEPRDSRGRWTRFGGVGEAADVAMREREGFSVSPRTGEPPPGGYMVAQTGATHTYPESILDDHTALTRAIDDMLMSEPGAFTSKDTYLGGWVHDGKLWLEPSDNFTSREQAEAEGRRRNQIAIFDLNTYSEISTGGSGGGRITEHDASGHAVRSYHEGPSLSTGELPGPARRAAAGGGQQASDGYPAGIAAQAIELAAWQHEPRGPHGEWVSEAAQLGGKRGLLHAATSFLADQGGYRPASPDVHQFTTDAASRISGLLGGGRETFSGQVQVWGKLERPDSLAEMGWDGTMKLRRDVADQLSSDLAGTGKVGNPDNFHTVLHELIHSNVREGTTYADGKQAYQDIARAWIEEGFTELGATQHAEQFFRNMGIGDRPADGGTMAELARKRAADPQPGSWGHYAEPEDVAHSWLEEIVAREGVPKGERQARINELADEMNRVGVKDKVDVMVAQIISAITGGDISQQPKTVIDSIEKEILDNFGQESGEETVRHAAHAAQAAMAAERAA